MARSYKRDKNGRFAGGGGGGGGSRGGGSKPIQRGTNRLTRDNAGRITSQGGNGATARGGRLATASGNKRATQTAKLSGGGSKGTVGKPKGLKPQDSGKLRKGVAYNRLKGINEKMGDRPDIAQQHIPGRFRGQAGKRMDASIDRAVKQVNAAKRPASSRAKPKAAAAVKPKASPSQQSQRLSRAKQVEKRRGMNISNPAAWRQESAGNMAANAKRTQARALAVYKNTGKTKRPAVGKIDNAKAGRIVARIDANRPGRSLANGSARKTANSIRTHERAVEFALASSRRAMRKGSSSLTVNESLQKAVANASKKKRK